MSKALIEKLKRARETGVTVNGHTFTFTRPTEADMAAMQNQPTIDFLKKFVIGWDLTELDIIPGGGPEKVPFDRALWELWIVDRSEYWGGIAESMIEAYKQHAAAREENAKN
jgi:hypothetical protein